MEANCTAFVRALCTHLKLDYAAVWVQSRHLPRADAPDAYVLAGAWPQPHVDATHLAPDHPLVRRWEKQEVVSVSAPDPAYAVCHAEHDLPEGTFTLLRLGELGFLKLHDDDSAPFVASAWTPLHPVLEHFTTSLSHSLTHLRAVAAIDEHERRTTRLHQVVERLSAILGSLHTGVLIEDDALEVALVNQAFCDLLGLDEAPDALIGMHRSGLIQRLRPRLAHPDADLLRLGRMAQVGQPAAEAVLSLTDGRRLGLDYAPLDADGFRGHVWQYHAMPSEALAVERPAQVVRPVAAEAVLDAVEASTPFEPAALVRAAADAVREMASARGLTLRVFASDGLAPVLVAPATTLREVLHTLLEHAIRHTERGHVGLTAVPVGRQRDRVVVQFSVADTGRGLAGEALDHLFDPDRHPRLARARQHIGALGGDLSVQSVRGRGSVFTIVVPCRLPEEELS